MHSILDLVYLFRSYLNLTVWFCYAPFLVTLRCKKPHLTTAKLRPSSQPGKVFAPRLAKKILPG